MTWSLHVEKRRARVLEVSSEYEWIHIPAKAWEIGLRVPEARVLAELTAQRARARAALDPDQLHPDRESQQLAELWGNPDYLFAQLAHSMPAHVVQLPAFSITKTPVTLAHFTRFRLETGALPRATYNAEAAKPLPPRIPDPVQPVTGLAWSEAVAFATWATCELPLEAMWEAALRPASRSPFGASSEDLYEWCADEFAAYPGADKIAVGRIEPPPGGWWGTRTRRGGAIPGLPVTVVSRGGADPSVRLRDTTFRLVRR